VRYDETVTIATPEGVDLELTLAGAGSRFVSALVDLGIQLLLALATLAALGWIGGFGQAVVALCTTLIVLGYDIFFEVLAAGRTPGKRLNGMRVVRSGGEPVGFLTSAIRNVLRAVDFLPFAYVIGAASILATRKNQRLGDVAAGTLVVRDRALKAVPRTRTATAPPETMAWDTSAITAEEVAAVRRFLERRHEIESGARAELAHTFAARLWPKVGGAREGLDAETFLTLLVAAKSARGAATR
jgi:uncharacterized RDD family membrane protein YckC